MISDTLIISSTIFSFKSTHIQIIFSKSKQSHFPLFFSLFFFLFSLSISSKHTLSVCLDQGVHYSCSCRVHPLFELADERRWEGAEGWKRGLNVSSQSCREIRRRIEKVIHKYIKWLIYPHSIHNIYYKLFTFHIFLKLYCTYNKT